MAENVKPRVAVIGCGGTISTIAVHALDYIEYLETGRKMQIGEVIERLGDLAGFVALEPIPFRAVSSSAIGPQEWLELARILEGLSADRPDIAAAVILHGTGTLEETAYFLNLTLKTDLPVVLTGAQRPFNTVGSDAAINILSALRVAIDVQSRGRGVLVVMNDEIHQARDVTKTSTYRLAAFKSPEFGPLGVVDADRVSYYRGTAREHGAATPFIAPPEAQLLPRVDIAHAYAGADGTAVKAYVEAGARGLISAGFAPGMTTPEERRALEEASERGVIIVQASRVGTGRVARRDALIRKGWIGAGDLNPQKARILLMLALGLTKDPEVIQEYFDRY